MSKHALYQMLTYKAWESNALTNYSTELAKYNSLKEKEASILEQKSGKTSKKDILLKCKADNTLTKIGNLELENIQKEEQIEDNFRSNNLTIEQKRDRAIQQAHLDYEKAKRYYDSERERSLGKAKREYDAKKRTLESRGEQVEQLRTIELKTSAEISLDKQKYDLLVKLQDIIDTINMSRRAIDNADALEFETNVPVLPEPLVKK